MGYRVPRVTVKVDFGKESSFGELSLISLGYGLHQAWVYSTMFDRSGIFSAGSLEAGPFNDQLSLAYFVSILVYGVALLVASMLDTKLVEWLHSTLVLAVSALFGTIGTLLLLPASGLFGVSPEVLHVVSGVFTGLGSSVLLLAWGIAFARRDPTSIVLNGSLSITIGFAVYGLVLHQLPFPSGAVISALISPVEVVMLLILRRKIGLDFDSRPLTFEPLPVNRGKFALRFGIPVFLLGVSLGIMRQTSIETILPGSSFENQSFLFICACCATVVILIVFVGFGGNNRWHILFRPLIPFIAVTTVFIPLSANGDSMIATSIVLIGYMAFEALMWIFFAEVSQRFRLSPIFICGLGRGLMALAALTGSVLPLFAGANSLQGILGDMGVVVLLILAMLLAYALLPDEKEIAELTGLQIVPHDASREGSEPEESDECENEPQEDDACENENESEEKRECAPACSPSAARLAMYANEAGGHMPVSNGQAQSGAAGENDKVRQGKFRKRLEAVANTYLLSSRETEVLYYLAHGYKSSFIQQQLYISEGTAKTHIRHIYRKLNVHSQQELIQLIDEIEL